MPGWHLEALARQDLDEILSIDRTVFKRPWHRNAFVVELNCDRASSYAVTTQPVDRGRQIIAYVFLRIIATEMNIARIAVAREFQRKGVATWLLEHCFRLAVKKNVFLVRIEVRPTNNAAITLYRKSGFQLVGTRPNYYPETGEDAMIMIKQVKESL